MINVRWDQGVRSAINEHHQVLKYNGSLYYIHSSPGHASRIKPSKGEGTCLDGLCEG